MGKKKQQDHTNAIGPRDEDALALKYAGFMGHTVAIVATVGRARRVVCQASDVSTRIDPALREPVVYQRINSQWKRV
jgi:hypothetical protein